MARQKISVCIITKNNEKTLDKCLSSIKPLADEIILVDTGSVDKTLDIANKFTKKVYEIKWENNFSIAKNFAISNARGDWIFAIDADEFLSSNDVSRIKLLVESADTNVFGFALIQRNYTNRMGAFSFTSVTDDPYKEVADSINATGFVPRRIVRLFKNHPKIRFEGVVHDSPENSIRKYWKVQETDIPIHHLGLMDRDPERTRLYIEMEKSNLRQNDYFQLYQIASQLHSINELDEALNLLEDSISINPIFYLSHLERGIILIKRERLDEAEVSLKKAEELLLKEPAVELYGSHLAMVYSHLGIILGKKQNFKEAIEILSKAAYLSPKNADIYFNLGLTCHMADDKLKAGLAFKKAIELNPAYKEIINFNEEKKE